MFASDRALRWRKAVRARSGQLLSLLLPDRLIEAQRHPFEPASDLMEGLIRSHVLTDVVARRDYRTLARFHEERWRHQASRAPQPTQRSQDVAGPRGLEARYFDAVVEAVAAAVPRYEILYELGCRDGVVVQHLASRLPSLQRLVGIDLNEGRIHANRSPIPDARVELVAGSVVPWIYRHGAPRGVFVTHGVLSYLPPSEVFILFDRIADRNAPALICLLEPFEATDESAAGNASVVFGDDLRFNHDYPRLLRNASFTVLREEKAIHNGRWLQVVIAAIG